RMTCRHDFVLVTPPPPPPKLFPYTTLFRSEADLLVEDVLRGPQSAQGEPGEARTPGDRGRGRAWTSASSSPIPRCWGARTTPRPDRKSTRLNSSHVSSSYAVFCLKRKTRRA